MGVLQDAVESKKRETMMVGLNKSRSEIGTLQDSLAAVQLALERREFDLEAKTSTCTIKACSLTLSICRGFNPYIPGIGGSSI